MLKSVEVYYVSGTQMLESVEVYYSPTSAQSY